MRVWLLRDSCTPETFSYVNNDGTRKPLCSMMAVDDKVNKKGFTFWVETTIYQPWSISIWRKNHMNEKRIRGKKDA